MADHPRSAFHGLNWVLKSLVCRINSSEDIASYRFWRFGLKLPIHAPFGEFWGIFSRYDVTYCPDPQKDRPWSETHHLNHSALESVHRFDLGAGWRNIGQYSKQEAQLLLG